MSHAAGEIVFSKLQDFNNQVYRNIQAVELEIDEFDDLTTDLRAKSYAHKAANAFNKASHNNTLHYHAIDFIFTKKTWPASRFSNGQFPVWYSSTDLLTSFYETLYNYKRTFIEAPGLNTQEVKMLKTTRTVFKVKCAGALIDLRGEAEKFHVLIAKDPALYPETQTIGLRVYKESYPGLIARSARSARGDNVIIFKKNLLSHPVHEHDYIYEYDFIHDKVRVKQKKTAQVLLEENYQTV